MDTEAGAAGGDPNSDEAAQQAARMAIEGVPGSEETVPSEAESQGKGPGALSLLEAAADRRSEVLALLKHATEGEAALSPDDVHDLRVAVRRLSEAAKLVEELMDKGTGRAVEESLKTLRQSAGELRDLDVASEHLAKWRMPGAVKKVAMALVERQQARRGELETRLRESARSASVMGTMVLLARVLEEQETPERGKPAEERLERALEKRIGKRRKQLEKAFGKAARKQTAPCLHAARIAAKKLRYVLELEKETDGHGIKRELKFLKGVQQLLGDHHDVHVIIGMMQKEVDHTPARGEGMIKGLAAGWRTWRGEVERDQARRAADFFMQSYRWMNGQA